MLLICHICFYDCSLHLMRRFAGRDICKHIRIEMLCIFNPSRTAGSNQWKLSITVQAFDQLIGFFHNGQIRTKFCIKHFIKSKTTKCLSHSAFYIYTDWKFECFTKCCSDGRSHLYNHIFIRIFQCLFYLIHLCFFCQCTNRADSNTLSAVYTACSCQSGRRCRLNFRIHSITGTCDG